MIRSSLASYFAPLVLVLIALSASPERCASADDADTSAGVSYTVDLSQAANHYVNVTMESIAVGPTEVMMPVWTPGSYLIREYARHIDHLSVKDAEGGEIAFRKTRKNRWMIDTADGQKYRVSYRLYCNEVSVRTNFTNHYFAVLNGAPTFITPLDRMDRPYQVQLVLPEGWRRSASSLISEQPHQFTAPDFDELVDSPIVAGQLEVFPFDVNGIPHQLVQIGDGAGYWDGTKAARDLQKIVAAQAHFWGVIPYDRYLFLNVIGEAGGGLEHDYNCLMLTRRFAFRDPKAYDNWLSLASHELFHAWNVRRLRPAPLRTYDYERETYTDSLWVAEGVTSYFEDIFLVSAGLIDEESFLQRMSQNVSRIENQNGQRVQSLRDASFDTWIKFYRPDENSSNTRVSYYSKGAVVALLLDAEIQTATGGERSLMDVLRTLYEQKLETGYTEAEFRSVASEIAGVDLNDWFATAVDSTEPLDYGTMLDWYGLQFGDEADQPESSDASDEAPAKDATDSTPWLGVTLEGASISKLQEDSPGYAAGFNTGDEILAINSFRLRAPIAEHLKQFQVGDTVEVLLDRKGELIKRFAVLGKKPTESWELRSRKEPTEQQTVNRSRWLGTKVTSEESAETESTADPES